MLKRLEIRHFDGRARTVDRYKEIFFMSSIAGKEITPGTDLEKAARIASENPRYFRVYSDSYIDSTARVIERVCSSNLQSVKVISAERRGKILGFAIYSHNWVETEIEMLYVDPDEQGGKIGTALAGHMVVDSFLMDASSSISLVSCINAPGFYKKIGLGMFTEYVLDVSRSIMPGATRVYSESMAEITGIAPPAGELEAFGIRIICPLSALQRP